MNVPTRTQDWVPQIEGAVGPIYLAIADAIGAAVTAGTLRAGDRLPTHRALADSLKVDLTTVTRAYTEAQKRGLLQARVGRGTFVRSEPSAAPVRAHLPDGPVDLGMNLPPIPTNPPLPALLQQGLSRLLAETDPALLLTYRTGCGSADERAAGAAWLRPTLGEIDPERVLVCPGAQPALFSILGMIAASGDVVLTDPLTYPGIRGAASQLGIRLAGVRGDADGMLPDALDEACHTLRPKALYCLPTIQNPTTTTMPLERRRAIAEVARRHGLRILEDDAYGLLPSAPLPALAALAPELTFHVATVSKTLSPALRVAWVVAPDARQATRLCATLRRSVLMGSPLLTGLLANWVHDGTAGAILAAVRRESAARQRLGPRHPAGGLVRRPPRRPAPLAPAAAALGPARSGRASAPASPPGGGAERCLRRRIPPRNYPMRSASRSAPRPTARRCGARCIPLPVRSIPTRRFRSPTWCERHGYRPRSPPDRSGRANPAKSRALPDRRPWYTRRAYACYIARVSACYIPRASARRGDHKGLRNGPPPTAL